MLTYFRNKLLTYLLTYLLTKWPIYKLEIYLNTSMVLMWSMFTNSNVVIQTAAPSPAHYNGIIQILSS